MRVGKEIAYARVPEQLIQTRRVAALRQPDPLRPLAEMALEFACANLDLGPNGVAVDIHQRQETMRCRAGDQLQLAGLVEAPEAVEQIVAVLADEYLTSPLET